MARPSPEPIDRTSADWVTRFNDNMAKVLDAPLALVTAADVPALTSAFNPNIYNGCFAVIGTDLYLSNGTTWEFLREQLTYVADLNPSTATLSDVKDAYNALLADMRAKDWMLT